MSARQTPSRNPETRPHEAARSHGIYQPLRFTFVLVPLLAGLDKFFGLLADWDRYLHPAIADALPVAVPTFMGAIGVVEIAVGLLVLSRFTALGASLAAGWLTLIAIQLVALGSFDIAVRDLAMAVAAYTLARLAAVRAAAGEGALEPVRGAGRRAPLGQPART